MLIAGLTIAYLAIGLLTGPYFVYRYTRHKEECDNHFCWCDECGSDLESMVEFFSYTSIFTWPVNSVFVFLVTPLFCYGLAPLLTRLLPFIFGRFFSAIGNIYSEAKKRGTEDGKAIVERRVKDRELKAQEEKLEADANAIRIDATLARADEILKKAGNYEEEIS